MLEAITENAQFGVNFSIETTLSGLGYSRMIPTWRALDYKVKLIFLELPNIQTAISRVSERVKQGVHNIPSEIIERRFIAGLRNFHEIYKPFVDTWIHFDNAGSTPNLLDWNRIVLSKAFLPPRRVF